MLLRGRQRLLWVKGLNRCRDSPLRGACLTDSCRNSGVEIYHPTQSVAHEASTQRLQGLMSRATRPEAIGAGKKVLLVDGLQDHDNRPLRHLVLEGWKAEGPKRSSSIALGDVHPPDRRCLVAAGLDALQKIQKVGLQVLRVLCRHDTVDTGSTILAGEPVGFPHPFQVEDVVQRGQCHPAFRSCQFSYPLPFRGQVCKAQGPLPCCPSAVLSTWRLPSLDWVPVSPVPQRHKHYEGATTPTRRITGRLFGSLPVPTRFLHTSCSLLPALPGGWRTRLGPGSLISRRSKLPACSHVGVSGTSQVSRRSILCLCPGPRPRPNRRSLT